MDGWWRLWRWGWPATWMVGMVGFLSYENRLHPFDPSKAGPGRNGPTDFTDMLVWVLMEAALVIAILAPWRQVSPNRVAVGSAFLAVGAVLITPSMIFGGGLLLSHLFGVYIANVGMGMTLLFAIAVDARSGSTAAVDRDKA